MNTPTAQILQFPTTRVKPASIIEIPALEKISSPVQYLQSTMPSHHIYWENRDTHIDARGFFEC